MIIIREMKADDKDAVLGFMREFYSSPAVSTNGSEEIFKRDINACISNSPYLKGYVFDNENQPVGYAMLAFSFSTEFGKPCVWLEDIFIAELYRGQEIAGRFIEFVREEYPDSVVRLEVEKENTSAVRAYKKQGFRFLPYEEMITGESNGK